MRLQPGPMTRKFANERNYIQYREKDQSYTGGPCGFCSIISKHNDEVLGETEHCLIIVNKFGYDIWDGCGLSEHNMLIPKRHVASLSELSHDERIDYMNTVAKYEAEGYSLYARSPGNTTKSVVHQHTHLMKIDNIRKNWLIYLRKPHILWSGR